MLTWAFDTLLSPKFKEYSFYKVLELSLMADGQASQKILSLTRKWL